MAKLKLCRFCKSKPIVESWNSKGLMFMVKCPKDDCKVPFNGYPTGHNLDEVKKEWNRRNENEGDTL